MVIACDYDRGGGVFFGGHSCTWDSFYDDVRHTYVLRTLLVQMSQRLCCDCVASCTV